MRAIHVLAFLFLLASAASLAAQVPRDPLANSQPGSAASNPAARQLPAPYVTRQTEVEIPFSIRSGTTPDSQPTAIRIYVSWDRGKTWHFYDERRPEESRFRFRPRQDGEFWFATQTIDRGGKPDAPEPRSPQLRVVIDTQRPQLLVQANVAAPGEISLAWSAADANLVSTSLKIEYQDATRTGGPWQPVEVRTANASPAIQASGQTKIMPSATGSVINLRAEIADAAGNVAYFSQRVSLAPPPKSSLVLAKAPAVDPTATRWPSADEQTPRTPESSSGEQVRIVEKADTPAAGPGRLASTIAGGSAAATLPPPSIETLTAPPMKAEQILPPPQTEEPTPRDVEPVETPSAQSPRMTNSRRFTLDYDLQSVGPEGAAAVELWGTIDGGHRWTKWGVDPDKTTPFDVEVGHEANYGFRIVVVGKNGLATSTPQAGDAADIWVGVDLSRPTARLTGAVYGQAEAAGKLDIRWEAEDANLGSRPITLSMSDRPSGPFTVMAAGLPNTGQYFWEFDPRSPRQIYLRLEVRDDAGNVSIDQLAEPIKVEGLEPKGRIRGFSPGPTHKHGAVRSPIVR